MALLFDLGSLEGITVSVSVSVSVCASFMYVFRD